MYTQIRDGFEKDTLKESYCGKAKDIFLKPLKTGLKKHKQFLKEENLNLPLKQEL